MLGADAFSPVEWKSRVMDMLHRFGPERGGKPRVADEIMPSEVKPPSAPAAAKRPARKRAAPKKK